MPVPDILPFFEVVVPLFFFHHFISQPLERGAADLAEELGVLYLQRERVGEQGRCRQLIKNITKRKFAAKSLPRCDARSRAFWSLSTALAMTMMPFS